MTESFVLKLDHGLRAAQWVVDGPAPLSQFFAFIAAKAELEAAPPPPEPACRIVGCDDAAWQKLPLRRAGCLDAVLKIDWNPDSWRSVACVNLDTLPASGPSLLLLRRILFLHGFLPAVRRSACALFHGALLVHPSGSTLIAGKSGTGKSTCAHKVQPPWHIPADDCVLIARTPNGYQASPLPTWSIWLYGQPDRNFNCRQSFPLQRLAFLEQAEADAIIPVNLREAVQAIAPSISDLFQAARFGVPPAQRPAVMRQKFLFAAQLAESLPACRLAHTRPGRPWECWGA